MRLSLNWLRTYVDLEGIANETIIEALNTSGSEVEQVQYLASGTDLVIGEIQSVTKHPDSAHLNICQVTIGTSELLQIVCGAPNVSAKQRVIVAKVGAKLPQGVVIKAATIRGVESSGMICSLLELGIEGHYLSDAQKEGIEVLAEDAPIGHAAPLSYLGLDDVILELGITPNRADCLSMQALAIEVAGLLEREMIQQSLQKLSLSTLPLDIQTKTATCPALRCVKVEGIKVGPAPQWLVHYLMGAGIKSVNNIVDISNYIMLETGQPLHMYDADKVGRTLYAETGYETTLTLLDNQTVTLKKEDIVITNGREVLSLGGVMGGDETKVSDETTAIIIESACFDGLTIRTTARRLNLLTDAAMRFIKGTQNPIYTDYALERACSLLAQLGCATTMTAIQGCKPQLPTTTIIELSVDKVEAVLGIKIEHKTIIKILTNLGFTIKVQPSVLTVEVPLRRPDIVIQEDLIEEIMRVYGYDLLVETLPMMEATIGRLSPIQKQKRQIANVLRANGVDEVITYTLTSEAKMYPWGTIVEGDTINLMSPLSQERTSLRKSLVPSLLEVVAYNQARQNKEVAIYEYSNVYTKTGTTTMLGIVLVGHYMDQKYHKINLKYDFYTLKGMITTMLSALGFDSSRYSIKPNMEVDTPYHPNKSAALYFGKQCIGYFGEIHPLCAKHYQVKKAYIAELNLSWLQQQVTGDTKFKSLSSYPSVTRDFAFIVDKALPVHSLVEVIKKYGKKLIQNIEVFDVYVGEKIGENKKSVALSVVFQDREATLLSTTVDTLAHTIIEALEKTYGATLRCA